MSGPLGSSQWMYSSGGFYPYEIEQSLRFNDDDSARLDRTPASAGNRRTWTWSGWVKRGNLGNTNYYKLFSAGSHFSGNQITSIALTTYTPSGLNDAIVIGSGVYAVFTEFEFGFADAFRDPSAWYHIVVAMDTTEASDVDRCKVWVNNRLLSGRIGFAGRPTTVTLNYDTAVNNTVVHNVGGLTAQFSSEYFDGYLAEVNFIDGTALDTTSFGEFKSGVWVPKEYTGSYGTNGFYLSFADSAVIGDDLSGNGNDWTPSGLASTDVLLDSPTNNYAVLNPITPIHTVLSDGNLQSGTGDTWSNSTIGMSSGKWYAEFTLTTLAVVQWFGVGQNAPIAGYNGQLSLDYSYAQNGEKYNNNVGTAYGATYTSGDVIGVAFDADAGELTFYKNGVSQGAAYSGMPAGVYYFQVYGRSSGGSTVAVANFGQSPFAYTPPAGFLALNTANLPEPTITPALDDVPADYFNTLIWSADGTNTTRSFSGVGFSPDLVWAKKRSGATNHQLYDRLRGAGNDKELESNTTGAEGASNAEVYGYLSSFDADGFTATAGTDPSFPVDYFNGTGSTYVAWNWKAAGAGVANTDGTISSTVSANQKAGFSIVSYTGDGVLNQSVGHGLGVAPKMTIVKSRDTTDGWLVYTDVIDGSQDYLSLNTTAAKADAGSPLPTASVVYMGGSSADNGSGIDYIAYCFAEVEGYSKFGSYTGNGSADGPFCWNGFKPALIMVKRTDTTSNWAILDDAREGYNVDNDPLYPNLSNAEGTTDLADLLSNGFKLRTTDASVNASGGTYIFAAFAETPFKFSNAR